MKKLLFAAAAVWLLAACNKELGPEYETPPVFDEVTFTTATQPDKITEPVKVDTKRKSTKVKLKSITFRPDMALRSEVGNIKVLPLKQRNVLQKPLTPEEIDKRLEKFFTTHDFMTKGDFYSLTGMTRTTATRHIRRLCDEGKLENKGLQKQPIYVQKKA